MPSIYIILEKRPKVDVYANDSFLPKNNDELGRMAKRLGAPAHGFLQHSQ